MTNRDKKDSIRGRMADTGEPYNVARRKNEAGPGFFDSVPAVPEPALLRRQHPWDPPEAELPGLAGVDTLLLGRSDQVVVALTGISAFSAGMEFSLTVRIRASAGHPEEHQPGGPRDLAAARASLRFGLQYADGTRVAWSNGGRRPEHDAEPAGPVLYPFAGGGTPRSFISRWWAWPLPPAGSLEFICAWPAFGLAESRAVVDVQLIRDAAGRSLQLWPENEG